jgi:hypothetical protein
LDEEESLALGFERSHREAAKEDSKEAVMSRLINQSRAVSAVFGKV